MFQLIESYKVDLRNLKFDHIRYSPRETNTIKTANSQI